MRFRPNFSGPEPYVPAGWDKAFQYISVMVVSQFFNHECRVG